MLLRDGTGHTTDTIMCYVLQNLFSIVTLYSICKSVKRAGLFILKRKQGKFIVKVNPLIFS